MRAWRPSRVARSHPLDARLVGLMGALVGGEAAPALAFAAASTPQPSGALGGLGLPARGGGRHAPGTLTANGDLVTPDDIPHARPGDIPSEAQLAAIYHEYSGQIHTYAYHLLGNQDDADDVTQEVFIRAYGRLAQLREAASLRAWLYRIATNICMDYLRRRSRVKRVLGVEFSLGATGSDESAPRDIAQPAAAAALEGVAERDHIALAFKRMPAKYASCLLLHSLQGLSYREIAEALGLSPGAAAVRLSRARDLFARYYNDLRGEEPR